MLGVEDELGGVRDVAQSGGKISTLLTMLGLYS